MKLYEYWRSSASYRVRIGLSIKQQECHNIQIDLRQGAQHGDYRKTNSAGLVPTLEVSDTQLTQSVAILNYLDTAYPEPPLYPENPLARAEVEALVFDIACDLHPLNNVRVLQYLEQSLGADQHSIQTWYHHWLALGFDSLEHRAGLYNSGDWFYHDRLTMADVVLVPQIYNALRVNFDLSPYPRLQQIYQQATRQPDFMRAAPRDPAAS